jgi:hypothetical protein
MAFSVMAAFFTLAKTPRRQERKAARASGITNFPLLQLRRDRHAKPLQNGAREVNPQVETMVKGHYRWREF